MLPYVFQDNCMGGDAINNLNYFRIKMGSKFTIVDEITRQYRWFNTVGTHLTVRLLPPSDENAWNPISHFIDSPSEENASIPVSNFLVIVTDLCEYALRNCDDSDMVGISIRSVVNVKDKAIGISFRRQHQLSAEVIVNVWENVTQSNSCFNALDTLVLEIYSIKMQIGFGRGIKNKGRSLATLPWRLSIKLIV